MKLSELADEVAGAQVEAGPDYEVHGIAYDSRRAEAGDLFVAVRGLRSDGHDFAADAASRGAAVALERPVPLPPSAAWLLVPDTRRGLGELAAAFQGRPSRRLLLAGITGTDGKTTTTHMAAHVLEQSGLRAGYMSTVALRSDGDATDNVSGLSTTESPEVQAWLARMLAAGSEAAVIETTSHALVQERVAGCDFDVAAITNVGYDHLDFHGTWDGYLAAKARLIELCANSRPKGLPKTAVLNRDDVSYERLAGRDVERRWSYSIDREADIRAIDVEAGPWGSHFHLLAHGGEAEVDLRLPARFNVYNALCAAGVCLALGVSLDAVGRGLSSFGGVRGRLEPVEMGQPFRVYIDFAHSAGSLASALNELRPFTDGRLLLVFGSTARSDHDRPGMGRAAAKGADFFIITTDDPVDEDPAEIAREVQSGVEGRQPGRDYDIVLDRRTAIRQAIGMARPGDVVLLAGKGHERSMIVAGGGRQPWDERAEAEAAIREAGRA